MKRRQAIKALVAAGGGLAAARLLKVDIAYAENEMVTLDNPTAKALQYAPDASTVATKPEKMGVKGSDQSCSNCQFAVGDARKVDGHEGEYVPCQLFQKNLVSKSGWCTGWAPKAA